MIRGIGRHRSAFLAASVVLGLLVGCDGGEPDNVTITGKVVYADGKPLKQGMIVFSPKGEGDAAPQTTIREDGTFALSDVGIPPGEYRVSLAPPEETAAPTGEGVPGGQSFRVPEKFLDANTSGWIATIKESGNEPLEFTLN